MNIVDRLNHHLFKDTVLNYFQYSFLKTVSLNFENIWLQYKMNYTFYTSV